MIKMKTCQNIFFLFLLILITPKVFPQLDSVYYQGPSQGSVSSGAIQSTDNFSDNISVPSGNVNEIPLAKRSSSQTGTERGCRRQNEGAGPCGTAPRCHGASGRLRPGPDRASRRRL